jgi:crossover junction endodeoxyribonuclease RuvC
MISPDARLPPAVFRGRAATESSPGEVVRRSGVDLEFRVTEHFRLANKDVHRMPRAPHFVMTPRVHLVLGVDPGLQRTGYALLERTPRGPRLREGGLIRSTPKMSLAHRVREISDGLGEVFDQFQPGTLAIEQVFSHARHPKTALLMAHARGVILLSAAARDVPVVHYTPRQIKKLLTGSGAAGKEQVQRAISHELGLDRLLEPNDVADAFAVALCHYYSTRLIDDSKTAARVDAVDDRAEGDGADPLDEIDD